jgi:hypothetical protein
MAVFLGLVLILVSVFVLRWGFPRLPARDRDRL